MNRLLNLEKNIISNSNSKQIQFESLRNSSSINFEQIIKFSYGPNYQWRLKTLQIIKNNPSVFQHYHLTEADRPHMRKHSAQKIYDAKKLVNLSYQEYLKDPNKFSLVCSAYVNYDAAFSIKNGVHWFLYMKTLFNLGSQKHKQFILKAVQYKDIGCFGLTELTHGSNVRGIKTEAHYNHETRSFVLNTTTKQAMKFWIGAAGNVANMSVIWAQLYVENVCYGVHAFVVPIRDKITHKLLPGVLIGDCGPKNGCNEIDNGFIILDNVQIPLNNMLDRISQIDQNGKFKSVTQNDDKRFGLQLGSLSGGRYMVAMNGSIIALQSLTISLRYSALRRQFSKKNNQPQTLLIQYPLMKRRLISLLAQNIVYLTGNMKALYIWDQNYKHILDPSNKVIQQLHAISSATKPKTGWFATQCIKESRQALGGHGFSSYSKLGTLYNDHDVNNTWEGDNTVLLQQCTKYIYENAKKALKKQKVQSKLLLFLQNKPSTKQQVLQNLNQLSILCPMKFKKFLQYKIHKKLQQMAIKMMKLSKQGKSQFEIWNQVQPFYGKSIALTFADLFYLNTFLEKLSSIKDEATGKVLSDCLTLWILKTYADDEFVDGSNLRLVENKILQFCEKLAGEVLGIVEALCAGDEVIGSPFSDENGKGMQKYLDHVMSLKGGRQKPKWFQLVTNR